MPGNYKYSKKAEADLIKIYKDTFLEWGSAQADKYDNGLYQTVLNLASNPEMGIKCDWVKSRLSQVWL
jgi:toxin ParE1/3/4